MIENITIYDTTIDSNQLVQLQGDYFYNSSGSGSSPYQLLSDELTINNVTVVNSGRVSGNTLFHTLFFKCIKFDNIEIQSNRAIAGGINFGNISSNYQVSTLIYGYNFGEGEIRIANVNVQYIVTTSSLIYINRFPLVTIENVSAIDVFGNGANSLISIQFMQVNKIICSLKDLYFAGNYTGHDSYSTFSYGMDLLLTDSYSSFDSDGSEFSLKNITIQLMSGLHHTCGISTFILLILSKLITFWKIYS